MVWQYSPTGRINNQGHYETSIRALASCCGVGEMSYMTKLDHPLSDWKNISDLTGGPYTGIFVCTYTKAQQRDGLEEELNKHHTLQHQTDFFINTGPLAGASGSTEGVRTAIYKWGKE